VRDWSVCSINWPRCCSGNCLGFYSGGDWVSLGRGTSCPDWECSWYTSVSPLKLQDNNFIRSEQFLWILSSSSYTSQLLLSNYKEQSLFWEANISSATQKIPCFMETEGSLPFIHSFIMHSVNPYKVNQPIGCRFCHNTNVI